jgi:dipeptidyl aminopeptidase/acylaminoacyl peptidase
VPWYRFPRRVEVWDPQGQVVAELASLPLAERVPIQGVITGPRAHRWRSTAGTAQMLWVEALDDGDPRNEVPHRDRLMTVTAPFDGQPRELIRLEDRSAGWSEVAGGSLAMVSEYDRDERWVRTWMVDVESDGAGEPRLIEDRSVQDSYGDPGDPVLTLNAAGRSVVRVDDGHIYRAGSGASPDGDRPFLDRQDLATLATERLWQNAGEEYERVVEVLPPSNGRLRFLTRRETPSEPPNYQLREAGQDERRALTAFSHPAPELLGITKQLVTYERDDGVSLSATLYLPPGHEAGGGERLPLVVWAYPREFNDPSMAGQVRGSPHRFTMFSGTSHLFLLTQGYAIMDGATMPVVGSDPETVNDSFIDQIVASARAAIDAATALGVADPTRVGVGGHSYGAFMTANLLAHSDLFRAGVARSGAYNRTLTPFGFQAERRSFWEAPEVYFALSPFMHADQIDEPLLLIHGQEDNNSGTFPMQSERMYHAVKGHGGTVRLVMLPEESHGYRARESVLHTLAEMVDWFDHWVKQGDSSE